MTREEAIKILDPKTCRDALMEYMGGVWDQTQELEMIGEAQKMGLSALRTQADTPPNDPLTPAELREMKYGEWVWIKFLVPHYGVNTGYFIKYEENLKKDDFQCGYPNYWMRRLPYRLYGDNWVAYLRKPDTTLDRREEP